MVNAIKYVITPYCYDHTYEVKLSFIAVSDTHQLKLPTWIPGSYMIREFSKNVSNVRLDHVSNQNVKSQPKCEQINKNTWQLSDLTSHEEYFVSYSVYAYDFGIRTAYLDDKRGYFNNTSLCMYIVGMEHYPHQLQLGKLVTGWSVATQLPKYVTDSNDDYYIANSYNELIDSPFELGNLIVLPFEVDLLNGICIKHQLVISGIIHSNFDANKLIADVVAICKTAHQIFYDNYDNGNSYKAPFSTYSFLLHLGGDIYTGLEHCVSTALLAPYYSLPTKNDSAFINEDYRKLLGLISHEYFHAWNVKSIKPKAFIPYNLESESYTKLLWWFEGTTSYYDDLILYKAQLINQDQYLKLVLDNINSVYKFDGVNIQSLSNSSLTAWIKYYRQDENSPNTVVSYYIKGALVAMCLDILIRNQTSGKKSLDNVISSLYAKWQNDHMGIEEDELVNLIEQYSTCSNLKNHIYKYVDTVDKLPLDEILALVGIDIIRFDNSDYTMNGSVIEDNNHQNVKEEIDLIDKPLLGCKLVKDNNGFGYKVQYVYSKPDRTNSLIMVNDLTT